MLSQVLQYSLIAVLIGLGVRSNAQADLYFIDFEDQISIPGVLVDISNEIKISSDGDGHVIIPKQLFAGKDSLCATIRLVGYESRNICFNQSIQTFELHSLDNMMTAVVVTAQHDQVRVDQSIHKLKVIDRKRIDQLAAINLEDVLMQELNMRVGQDAILGSGISIQGLSSSNVKILIDGVPVIGRIDGGIDLRQINLANVERIEIVQGPLSVQFGTDAIAGTINIITRKNTGEQFNVQAKTYAESIGTWNNMLSFTKNVGKGYIGIDATRNQFDGWIADEKWNDTFGQWTADSTRYKTWKPRLQHIVAVRGGVRNDKNDLNITLQTFDETIINRGLPRAPFAESAFDDRYHTTRHDIRANYNRQWSNRWKSQQVFAYNYYQRIKNTVLTDLTDLSDVLVSTEGAQDTSRFDLYMSRGSMFYYPKNEKYSFEFGYDLNYETTVGRRIDGQTKSIGDYAGYATSQIQLSKKINLKPAVRWGYNSAYDMPVIPSLNIMWQKDNVSWRASYARGFRAPSLKELYFFFVDVNHNIQGSTNLNAEQSNQYQTSVNWKKEHKGYFYRLDATGFFNDVENLITLAQSDNTLYTYINVGSFKTYGYNAEFNIYRGNWKTTFAFAGTTRVQGISDANKALTAHEGTFAITWLSSDKKWNAQLFNRIIGSTPNYIQTDTESYELVKGQGYTMTDLNVQYAFKQFRFTLGVKNLLDVQNINTASTGGAHTAGSGQALIASGRNFFGSIQFTLSKKK